MSWTMLSKPPTENALMTNWAPSSASARSVVAETLQTDVPASVAMCSPIRAHRRQRRGIEVVQDDLGIAQALGIGEVDKKARGPVRAPASDDGDPRGHGRLRLDG